jgi:DNA (cytosine-5)-methyltransferase 1
MARIICEVRPKYVFVENSPMLTSRGLGRVLGDLAAMGFDARWGVLGAADIGAVHQRDRIWIVAKQKTLAHTLSARQWGNKWQSQNEKNVSGEMAYTKELFGNGGNDNARISMERKSESQLGNNCGTKNVAYTSEIGSFIQETKQGMAREFRFAECGVDADWWQREPANVPRISQRNMGGMVDGVASRVDRLKAIGNGQVPLCAATAWRILSESL